MSENSKIEWTDSTFNPWIGCTKVSPGCAHCYAETLMDTRYGRVKWGKGNPRQRTSEANWNLPLKWNRDAGRALENWKTAVENGAGMEMPHRPRVFCASLADWLDDEVPIEWLADLLTLIHDTPNLDWLLLTKRPENWYSRIKQVSQHLVGKLPSDVFYWLADWREGRNFIPHNIWIGTTVEDQERADQRIPALLKIPAAVRFLSCEPLLGPVDLWGARYPHAGGGQCGAISSWHKEGDGIHWVICGGESGKDARPMHPDWARSLRDQCQAAGVPFLFKQWGEWVNAGCEAFGKVQPRAITWIRHDGSRWANCPEDENADCVTLSCVGKNAAGRILDGREHNEFPRP